MLQTYFMIPILRRTALQFPQKLESEQYKDTIKCSFFLNLLKETFVLTDLLVMEELQKLFTSLIFSNQKYIDPSNLLKKTIGPDGKPINIGNQEDVGGLFFPKIY